MMYTVYDFINNVIEAKHMKFGWKAEIGKNGKLILRHIMLNFDWKSLDFISDELWNMFLSSKSYKNFKAKSDKISTKIKIRYFESYNISYLKQQVERENLKIDVDSLIEKTIKRIAEKTKEKNEEKAKYGIQ